MVRIIMHGCNGKMGQVITGIVKEDANAEIVAGIDVYDGIKNTYPVFSSIEQCDVEADAWEFYQPSYHNKKLFKLYKFKNYASSADKDCYTENFVTIEIPESVSFDNVTVNA